MVRLPNTRQHEHDDNSTMTPMIDVVFLLLIFFVVTAGTQIVEYVMPSQMKALQGNEAADIAEPLPEMDFDNVIVRVRWDNGLPDWTINEQGMENIDQVGSTLQSLAAVNIDAPIVVHPDPDVPVGYVIEVFDKAKMSGFVKVSFALNSAVQ